MRQMRKWEDCKHEFDGDNEPTLGFVESFLEVLLHVGTLTTQADSTHFHVLAGKNAYLQRKLQ